MLAAPILLLENVVTVLGGGRAFLGKPRPKVRAVGREASHDALARTAVQQVEVKQHVADARVAQDAEGITRWEGAEGEGLAPESLREVRVTQPGPRESLRAVESMDLLVHKLRDEVDGSTRVNAELRDQSRRAMPQSET